MRLFNRGSVIPTDLNFLSGCRFSITDGGRVFIGRNCSLDRFVTILVKHGTLTLGDDCYVGIGSVLCARDAITIGQGVLIAEYVTIRDQDHVFSAGLTLNQSGFRTRPVTIGDNVWLGAKVTVMRGVTIGENAVIGANSVVTGDIPANVVAVGVPARVIRELGAHT